MSPEELENLLLDYDQVKEVVVYAENGTITAEVSPPWMKVLRNRFKT